jgi:hypothetical protein
MTVMLAVKQYIAKIPNAQPFATRELLPFGKRGTIDQILYLLVKRGHLERLARGVFCKLARKTQLPTIKEIAECKARTFGKTIVTHGIDAQKVLKMNADGCPETTYAVAGRSGSFVTIFGRVHFHGTVHTRVQTGDSKAGLAIRALAQIGRDSCDLYDVQTALFEFDRNDRIQLKKIFPPKMPGWLSDLILQQHYPRRRKAA